MAKCVVEFIKDQCSKKTSTYHHGNLKEELLKQAVEVINEDGVELLTLSVLSKRLGTSRSAIYRHFSSKNELIQNVISYGFVLFENKIVPIFEEQNISVLDRLYKVGKEYINFAMDYPNLYRILFGEKFQNIRNENCDIEDKEQAKGFHTLIELLIEGQEEDIIKKDVPIFQAQIIHSMVHGLASLYIDGHPHVRENIDELYKMCYNTMAYGLKKD